jgi:hypothetical protein
MRKLQELKIPEIIESYLGQRVKQAKYSNVDILTSWILTQLTTGFRLLSIKDAEKDLSLIPELNIPSHDTVNRFFKKIAAPRQLINFKNKKHPNYEAKDYNISENPKLNELLVQSAIALDLLKPDTPYTLDIDLTQLKSETRDSVPMRKNGRGYGSMVCSIGKIPVYIDIRDGNAPANYRLVEAIESCMEMLRKYNIVIDYVRSDGAGYTNAFLDYLDSEKLHFNVGADGSTRAEKAVLASKNWRTLRFQTSNHIWNAEFASAHYSLSKSKQKYILGVIRVKKDEREKIQPTKWKPLNSYYYKFVITNDDEISPQKLFEEYHKRGASEKIFDELKNDFGWRILPFSKINENLAYLQITAFTSIIYQGMLRIFSKEFKQIKPTIRLDKFKKEFIRAFAFAYVEGVLNYYGVDLDFQKIV